MNMSAGTRRWTLLMTGLALAMVISACAPDSSDEQTVSEAEEPAGTTLADVKEEATELSEAVQDYTAEQREEALREAQATMAQLDRKVDELEDRINAKWDSMSEEAQQKARASLDALHAKQKQLLEEYERLEASSAAAWSDMQTGFSEAYTALQKAWERAADEFDSEES